MIGLIITVLIGALIGWIASLILKTDGEQGFWLDAIFGIIGAFLARAIFNVPALEFSISSVFWGVIGAIIVISVVKLFTKKGNY